jgi:sugar/nucleoside kinase (ribokinase family)
MARAGLEVAVAGYLGAGEEDGLDPPGRAFRDCLVEAGVDVSGIEVHPHLPTGWAFVRTGDTGERGGVVYFPNANDDVSFARLRECVTRQRPRLVYYMYSGLSERGDARGGRDLADFMGWCAAQGCITTADSHTLTGNPRARIAAATPVAAYHLLEPLLPTLDIFFTSSDEARMIAHTLGRPGAARAGDEEAAVLEALDVLAGYPGPGGRPRLLGVTCADGVYVRQRGPDDALQPARHIRSRFLCGSGVDLVGAGDAFRAGLLSYLVRNRDLFRGAMLNLEEAVQTGHLFASLYVNAPLTDRYANVYPLETALRVVRSGLVFHALEDLLNACTLR